MLSDDFRQTFYKNYLIFTLLIEQPGKLKTKRGNILLQNVILFLERFWFGFCWCSLLVCFVVFLGFFPNNIYKGQIKLQSHYFGREGVIQSSVLVQIYLIRTSISRNIQQRHATPTRAHNVSGISYLFSNHPRVLGIFPLLLIWKLGATVRRNCLGILSMFSWELNSALQCW